VSVDEIEEEPMSTNWQHYQATGYEPIDVEHAQISVGLARLLEVVNSGKPMEAVLALESIAGQLTSHFAHEERLMAESGYQLMARHKQAHDLFLVDASSFLTELKTHGLSEPFRRWATGRALEWFRLHIAVNDVGLGRFLQAREKTELESKVGQPQ
jgi:hemerythrin-like metal-binding protein